MADFSYNSDLNGGSLMVRESRVVADLLISNATADEWTQAIQIDNLLQKRSPATAKRNAQAIRKRLQLIAPEFWKALRDGDDELATQVAFWHAFYGALDKSIFPTERYSLAYAQGLDGDTYLQKGHDGLFRARKELSGAILSFNDGNILFLNPWCETPLNNSEVKNLVRLYQFRPEYSYFNMTTLEKDIESESSAISFLLSKNINE